MTELQPRLGYVERFTLGKGVSRENGDGSWTKEYLELEVRLPENASDRDFEANFVAAEYKIDQLLEAPKVPDAPKVERPQVKITMTPEEVDALPWTASQWVRKDDQDRRARSGEDAWAREDEVKDPRLLQMIKEAGGKLEMPGVYSFERKVRPGYETGLIIRHGPGKKKAGR